MVGSSDEEDTTLITFPTGLAPTVPEPTRAVPSQPALTCQAGAITAPTPQGVSRPVSWALREQRTSGQHCYAGSFKNRSTLEPVNRAEQTRATYAISLASRHHLPDAVVLSERKENVSRCPSSSARLGWLFAEDWAPSGRLP